MDLQGILDKAGIKVPPQIAAYFQPDNAIEAGQGFFLRVLQSKTSKALSYWRPGFFFSTHQTHFLIDKVRLSWDKKRIIFLESHNFFSRRESDDIYYLDSD